MPSRKILIVMLALALRGAPAVSAFQAPAERQSPRDQMFSGQVTAVSESSLTAVRNGSKEPHSFLITSETRFEGPRPELNSRVTIRYVATDQGDAAVRIIVRSPAKD